MAQNSKKTDLFTGFNFFNTDFSSFFPSADLNEMMSSSMKMMEDATKISQEFMAKSLNPSEFFTFFENSAGIMTSYSDYIEMFGFISKDEYDQLIEKYNELQKEITNKKRQVTQKDNKIKDHEKKITTLEKKVEASDKKIKDLENELAAEKINKTTNSQGNSSKTKAS
ncbi:MAG: hypothetical protein ACQEQS_06090 [Thermodesulfobacteriota bacterium]